MSAQIHYRTIEVKNLSIFYREVNSIGSKPTLLLLHGFPTSSHQYRNLMPLLSSHFHIVAPDLPGFGFTSLPSSKDFSYTFDNIATVIEAFTEALHLTKYAIYVFDYGAPVGFRLAVSHPERISGIISQNGNAYESGLSDAWDPIRAYWNAPTQENRLTVKNALLTLEGTKFQYTHGVHDVTLVAPETYELDFALLSRPGVIDIQLDLFLDYAQNVANYPKFHQYFAKHQPRVLAIWGKNDPFFIPAGAEAFKKDLPNAQVQFVETGHFALETHVNEIAQAIIEFFKA